MYKALMIFIVGVSPHISCTTKIYTSQEKELITQLYEIGVFRCDTDTVMACGMSSPYYIDLRLIISYPAIFKQIIHLLTEKSRSIHYFDSLCGVPYGSLALSSAVAYELEKPLIMRRSVSKKHGTKKKIEGSFHRDDKCIIIEDVLTTGSSVIETIKDLENAQLNVYDCIIVFDREQGGVQLLEQQGYKLHVMFTISDFLNVLTEAGKISEQCAHDILAWTAYHQFTEIVSEVS